jgi:predicted PurR-regulated permease PerM
VMAGIGYVVIGLPNPFVLAMIAGLAEIIPILGPFIAFAPAVLVALTISPTTAVIVLVFAFVIQQLESYVLVPRIMGHTVGISPLTVFLGILIGATLYGIPGAFLAVPLAGAAQVILAHLLRSEDDVQAEAHVEGVAEAPLVAQAEPTPPHERAAA